MCRFLDTHRFQWALQIGDSYVDFVERHVGTMGAGDPRLPVAGIVFGMLTCFCVLQGALASSVQLASIMSDFGGAGDIAK